MKQEELFSYAYDFISQLLDQEEVLKAVRKIILFGSIVRGDFHEGSDVDLFIDTLAAPAIQKIVKKEQSLFEKRIEKTWALRGLTLPLKIQIGDLNHPRWETFRDQIAQYGKIMYGPYEQAPQRLHHFVLVTYELGKLKQKHKMAFLRMLYGYKTTKGKKEYLQKGKLESLGGKRIGTNSLLLPRDRLLEIRPVLTKYRVRPTLKDVWIAGVL